MILLVLFSCKKEENDSQGPSISISSPTENQSFTALQTITIQGAVSDDKNISSITISLRNANNIKVLSSISKTPNATSYQLNEAFVLDDLYLPSGSYTLKISANDGVNQTDKYISLLINEYPKIRNGLFVFSNSGSSTQITQLDNTFNTAPFLTVAGDFLGATVSSLSQQVFSCGNVTGNFLASNINTTSQNWMMSNNASGFQHFTSIFLDERDGDVYVGYYNRDIICYKENGIPKYSVQAFVNSFATLLYVHDNNFLITEQQEIATGVTRIVYYYLTGFLKDNVLLNEDVVSIFSKSSSEVIVFTNAGGNGSIKIFNLSTNAISTPFALGTGLITSCTEISNGIYLIAQNGNIIKVNYNNFTYSTYLSGVGANLVKYDSITNEVVVSSGIILTSYDYSTKSVKSTYTHSSTILAFDFWYNK